MPLYRVSTVILRCSDIGSRSSTSTWSDELFRSWPLASPLSKCALLADRMALVALDLLLTASKASPVTPCEARSRPVEVGDGLIRHDSVAAGDNEQCCDDLVKDQ